MTTEQPKPVEQQQRPIGNAKPAYRTERIIASLVMAWILCLTSYMIFQDKALSEASMYFLKILLSMSGAVMLATLPGFFDINYGVGGLSIRAAGGAAAFVFIYTQSPHIPNLKSTVAPVVPIESSRPRQSSDAGSFSRDAFPLMVALSFDPTGVASSMATSVSQAGGVPMVVEGDSVPAQRGSTVSYVVETVTGTVARVAQGAIALLDRSSTLLRTAVAWIGNTASYALGKVLPTDTVAISEIGNVVGQLPARAGELLETALAPALSAVSDLSLQLQGTSPLLGVVGETVAIVPQVLHGTTTVLTNTVTDLTGTVSNTLTGTLGSVQNLASGVLTRPDQALAVTGEAVGDITKGLLNTTKDVLATTSNLTKGVGEQLAVVTNKLNDVAPALVSQINPDFDRASRAAEKLRTNAGLFRDRQNDFTSALPKLSDLPAVRALELKQNGFRNDRLGERFNESAEVRGGCGSCVLPPLDGGALGRVGGALNNTLAGVLGGRGSGAAGASGGGNGGGVGGGSGPASGGGAGGGGGPVGGVVSGVVGAVGGTVSGLTKGLTRRR
jgi:hypothetical protein